MTGRGAVVNTALVEGAALLHDLDKALPAGDPVRALGHGAGGAAWLRANGYEELAEPVALHPVYVLGEAADYDAWTAGASIEARIVAYSDKRAIQDLVTLDQRFERWYRRYPNSTMLTTVGYERARRLERELCAAAGISPSEVRRLDWVDEALRQAA